MKHIELLAPAKNAEIAFEAIRCGADAVYIGGPSFGARVAASNTVEDIQRTCDYAHLYGAKVYVTFNTILYEEELSTAEKLITDLYDCGVDALITQDLALLKMEIPPIALHASTQMDTCTPEKAVFLEKAGFSQIVLARELSLKQIQAIARQVSVPIEVFVHGALCVSYSGRCYASQHCFGRSANRGNCAQFCRLAFDLIDADGRIISSGHHLSLRDMNRTDSVENLLDAGVTSLKIEGRLKDLHYVKNVTAHYRQIIDKIIQRRPNDYARSSYGRSNITFTPHVEKSFNRGFTTYFLHGRSQDIASPRTPKAVGAPVGRVKKIMQRSFLVDGDAAFANGDGLCFFDDQNQLQGFRINRAEGRELFPFRMPSGLKEHTELFRNEDRDFEKALQRPTAERTLPIKISLKEVNGGYELTAHTQNDCFIQLLFETEILEAQTPQRDHIIRQLSKLGGSHFHAEEVEVQLIGERFIPVSRLSAWRRALVEKLTEQLLHRYPRDRRRPLSPDIQIESIPTDYTANVANHLAKDFLCNLGAIHVQPAYELQPIAHARLMTCKHCLRYAHQQCPRETGHAPSWKEPVALRLPEGRTFPLKFDCVHCEMSVLSDD